MLSHSDEVLDLIIGHQLNSREGMIPRETIPQVSIDA
jgi:hypothetical protein